MQFLSKDINSDINLEGLVYKTNNNRELNLKLLNEQKNFCAYTEKYIQGNDSTEVEHFNPSKKGTDDYFNYYSVLRSANQRKISKYNIYKAASFFNTLFFQDRITLNDRIMYSDFEYIPVKESDQDAIDFIDYLGFNDDYLYTERIRHIERLKSTLSSFTDEQKITYFKKHKSELSYITAIEDTFNLSLNEIIE